MTIEETLKQMVLDRYGSVREFSIKNNIPYSTITSIFKRGISNAGINTIIKVCDALSISTDELALGRIVSKDAVHIDGSESRHTLRIPVYGCIAAGIPIEEIEDIDDWEEINYPGAVRGEYIALRIKGDSMEPRICEGDVIIIHIQPTVDNGDLAAVRVNDHYTDGVCATCKKVKFTSDGGIMLMSINPAYEPMYFSRKQIREEGVEIIGKVVELRGKLG